MIKNEFLFCHLSSSKVNLFFFKNRERKMRLQMGLSFYNHFFHPKHITIKLFLANKISNISLASKIHV